jgi:hypothetical protein
MRSLQIRTKQRQRQFINIGQRLDLFSIPQSSLGPTVYMLPASYRNTCRICHNAVDRLIKHFDGIKTLAIEFSIDNLDESVIFATDAAFADNRDRKSSEGYVMKMFGGVVDWKACKQTVTTSTTEAELLSPSNGARETYWWMRFFDAITLNLEKDVKIWRDNQQTVGLLTKDRSGVKDKIEFIQHASNQDAPLSGIKNPYGSP